MFKRVLEYFRRRKSIKYARINSNADFLLALGRAYSEVMRRHLNNRVKSAK